MAMNITTITGKIASLNVTGLDIYDIHNTPSGLDGRKPAVIPVADFVTDFSLERDSYGGGSTAKKTATYTLHYRLCYKKIGLDRSNILVHLDGLVRMAYAFLDAVIAIDTITSGNDVTVVDVTPLSVSNFGVVNDPAEIPFWGCDFSLRVTEFIN